MEKESDSKGKLESNSPHAGRSKSFSFRAPQEKFTIQDFELGKIYGVGSYSKVTVIIFKKCFIVVSFDD
nr:3-phosphoinositide-dependent protein kinase 2-like isoform X1 [Ipomoea batatas]